MKTGEVAGDNQHAISRILGLPVRSEMIGRNSLQQHHLPKSNIPSDKLQTQKRHLDGFG